MSAQPELCDYCGLPVPGGSQRARMAAHAGTAQEPRYCCYGCRFAAEVTRSGDGDGPAQGTLLRLGLAVFLSLNAMVFTMVLWSGDFYTERNGDPLAVSFDDVARWFCLLVSLPVLWLLGGPLARNAWDGIRQRRPTSDVLLLMGVVAAFAYSIVGVLTGGKVYFEVGCAVLVLVTLGRWLEAAGRRQASAALDALGRLLPGNVSLVEDGGERDVPLDALAAGNLVRVRPGQRIPADGQIDRGRAAVDEQLLTGEAHPAIKEAGDRVFGGTLNLDGDLLVRLTCSAHQGTLQRLVDAVTAARLAKGHYQRLADRVAAVFLPLVVAAALATFAWHGIHSGWQQGTMAALAVVLIACPCALGLATPLAIWTSLGAASQAQVVLTGGEALERLAAARAVCFDKTGTLTSGRPQVAAVTTDGGTPRDTIEAVAAALAGTSQHALAAALHGYLAPSAADLYELDLQDVADLPGRGVSGLARIAHRLLPVSLGSVRLMNEEHFAWSAALTDARYAAAAAGQSVTCVGWDGQVRGLFAFRESLRPEAAAAVAACRALGLEIAVLTGDAHSRGHALAVELGVPVQAELLPADKLTAIHDLRRQFGPTVMVGDGVNDAPALAAADAGIALGCGADVSRESADVCLLGDDLRRVPWSIAWSRRTVRVIRQNLFWSFAYNTVGIAWAASGWLNPVWAALAMVLSSVLVIGNSLRLAQQVPGVEQPEPAVLDPESIDACEPAGINPAYSQAGSPTLDLSYLGRSTPEAGR